MTISVVQSHATHHDTTASSMTATFSGVIAGNTLVLFAGTALNDLSNHTTIAVPAGWTIREEYQGINSPFVFATKVSNGTETTVTVTYAATAHGALAIAEVEGLYVDSASNGPLTGFRQSIAPVTPGPGVEVFLLLGLYIVNAWGTTLLPGIYGDVVGDTGNGAGYSVNVSLYGADVDPTVSGAYGGIVEFVSALDQYFSFQAVFTGFGPPVAGFTASPLASLELAFADASSGAPTSWAWDFGDGATSTAQDPDHTYARAGSFLVSLTVANAFGSDTITGSVTVVLDVGYTPPPPGGALLEIYAAAPGSARWGVAHWGEDLWSSAGWRDVTPQGVDAVIHWGSSQAEQGILSQPDPASWAVDFYDPERLLDPANASGPYYTDLRPGLPIRLSHHELEIVRGFVESIGHSYAKGPQNGYIRATDIISRLANAAVPADITLADTLYARAADAIAAAGLAIELQAVIGTDPVLAPWSEHDPTVEWSAWQWIADAAQQVLYVPLVMSGGILGFRAWSAPLTRGRSLDSPELLDLQVVGDYAGQYSVVEALQTVAEGGVLEQRALTPVPRYGKRTFSRQEPTPDIDAWLDAVLADRALPALRWVPGEVYPLTADSVHRFATIEAVELVSMAIPEQDPPVSATAIIVGGEISVVGKYASAAVWSFTFEAAQTAVEPLIETGGDPTDYLLATGGDQFLYPSS